MAQNKFYAVVVGHETGIFDAPWELVKEYTERVAGGATQEGFPTLQEAERWWKTKTKEIPVVYEIKFDPRTNEKLIIPKKEDVALW